MIINKTKRYEPFDMLVSYLFIASYVPTWMSMWRCSCCQSSAWILVIFGQPSGQFGSGVNFDASFGTDIDRERLAYLWSGIENHGHFTFLVFVLWDDELVLSFCQVHPELLCWIHWKRSITRRSNKRDFQLVHSWIYLPHPEWTNFGFGFYQTWVKNIGYGADMNRECHEWTSFIQKTKATGRCHRLSHHH